MEKFILDILTMFFTWRSANAVSILSWNLLSLILLEKKTYLTPKSDMDEYRKIHFGGVYMIKLPLIYTPDVCRGPHKYGMAQWPERDGCSLWTERHWSVPKSVISLWVIWVMHLICWGSIQQQRRLVFESSALFDSLGRQRNSYFVYGLSYWDLMIAIINLKKNVYYPKTGKHLRSNTNFPLNTDFLLEVQIP